MPTVSVNRDLLFELIGQEFTDEEFDKLCFEFGIELDEVVDAPQPPSFQGGSSATVYKIDIPANRLDLLSVEGIATALAVFLNKKEAPRYRLCTPPALVTTFVAPSTAKVRPHIVTAVVRGVHLTRQVYTSLIDLQEKLHHNICRKRAFVAIGVHNLSRLCPPFTYSADPPSSIRFRPLGQMREFAADELLDFYATDPHLKPYLHLLQSEPLYCVLRDSAGVVLSLPPLINGDHSKLVVVDENLVPLTRTDVFIECTATDLSKAVAVLDTLVAMLSQYSERPYEVETTRVVHETEVDDKRQESQEYPKLAYKEEQVEVNLANETVGIQLEAEVMAASLTRMGLKSKVVQAKGRDGGQGGTIAVEIPPTRHDILHQCDIMEDIAIAYGYVNIHASLPPTSTVGAQFSLNKLSRQLSDVIARAGFSETLTFSLCSIDDECGKLGHAETVKRPSLVLVANPKSKDFQAVRSTLLPGLLKTVHANSDVPLPLKLFEISDVVHCDESQDTGAINRRYLCALHYGKTKGLELVHGLLDKVMQQLEVRYPEEYWLEACNDDADDPTYFPGRCASVLHKEKIIGRLGVLNPEVLQKFGLHLSCSVLEICIEGFV